MGSHIPELRLRLARGYQHLSPSEIVISDINPPKNMNMESYKKLVKEKLKGMSKEQIAFFTWLCAVRSLPFLATECHLRLWFKIVRMKSLYAIFRALDLAYFYKNSVEATFKINYDAHIAALEARSITRLERTSYAIYYAAKNASEALDVASFAADGVNTAADGAASAADNCVSAYVCANENNKYEDILEILLSDIEAIKAGNRNFDSRIELYGEVWDNFKYALDALDCVYWANLYRDIIENSFKLDEEALKIRINVPKEIQEEGAAAVASYLENN